MIEQLQVLRSDINQAQMVQLDAADLEDGAIRLQIESFAITSNNITYAAMGDGFGYWNFFSGQGDWGIVPVWGHARVIASRNDDVGVGERVYGYLPMANSLDILPGHITPRGFVDTAAHRQPMSPIYNQYTRLAADPEHDPEREAERMIFGPLFKTGFLIEAFMRRKDWFGAQSVVLTSASSKTAMGLASVARQRSPGIRRIGLTSARNVPFVERTGLYDSVIAYDQVGDLPQSATVSVDFAGNAELLAQIHAALGSHLQYSCMVGATHHDTRGQAALPEIVGPKPELFFAPDHAVAIVKEMGMEAFGQELAESWHAFMADIGDTVDVERVTGLERARAVYVAMAGGTVDPAKGVIIEP